MPGLKSQEGELLVDHRNAPGLPEELLQSVGMPIELAKQLARGNVVHEFATYTCKHCQAVVIQNPQRTRERNYCRGCSHIICDGCAAIKAATGVCKTFDQFADEMLNLAAKSAV